MQFTQQQQNHNVKDAFKKVIRDDIKYEHVDSLKLNTQPILVKGYSNMLEQVRRFVNCIANFDNHSVLISSFDLFWHNQPSYDDSAFGLDVPDFYTAPVCKLKKKMTKNKSFNEASIYFGMIELLMIGGYVCTAGNLTPFLGSSLGKLEFQDQSTSETIIPTTQQPYMNTKRLLDHTFYDHASQKHKAFNIHHFASELLYVLCSKQAITKDMMTELWLSFTRTTFYKNTVNGVYIANFQEMKRYLDGHEARNVYIKLLVKVAVDMEVKFPNYSSVIFGLDDGRKNALDLMMGELKESIKKQNLASVLIRKKDLGL